MTVTERMSRRRRTDEPVVADRGPRPPRRPDIVEVPFTSVPVSATREMRVSLSISPTGRAAVVQTYARATRESEMAPVGRPFTVFRADLDALVSALTAAGPLLDAATT